MRASKVWLLLLVLMGPASAERASNVARGPLLVEDMHERIPEDGGEFLPILDAALRAMRDGVDPGGDGFSRYRLQPRYDGGQWPALLQSWKGVARFWGYDNGDRAEMSVRWFNGPGEVHTLTVEMVPLAVEQGGDLSRNWVIVRIEYEA